MGRRDVGMLALSIMTATVWGCGGGETPPAQAPKPSAKSAAAAPEKKGDKGKESSAADKQESEEAKGDSGEEAGSPEEEVFKPDRPPREIITSEDTTFAFKFESSDIGQKTEEKCREKEPDDPKAFNECKRKVRNEIGERVLRFKVKQGTWWWITYDRKGNQLTAIHRIAFVFGEETDNTITILPQGKDKGMGRMSPVPRKVVITIPNSYQIQLDDKQYGKMYYSATIGLLGGK